MSHQFFLGDVSIADAKGIKWADCWERSWGELGTVPLEGLQSAKIVAGIIHGVSLVAGILAEYEILAFDLESETSIIGVI